MTGRVTLTVNGDLAHVSIDNPPVNALSQALRKGLMEALADLKDQTGVKAVILCCTGRSFVAGADIRELGQTPVEPFLPDVVAAIEASSVPWIAALHGKVLGGGLELAMACHGRVAVMSAKLGLPEVTLGILPGAGGTVRLPRLVPMADAIALVTSGKTIAATQAHSIGLVDCLVEDDLIAGAETLALRLATQGTPPAYLVARPDTRCANRLGRAGNEPAQAKPGGRCPVGSLGRLAFCGRGPGSRSVAGRVCALFAACSLARGGRFAAHLFCGTGSGQGVASRRCYARRPVARSRDRRRHDGGRHCHRAAAVGLAGASNRTRRLRCHYGTGSGN